MKSRVRNHYEQHADFYLSIRTAVLMITALIIALAWELANA